MVFSLIVMLFSTSCDDFFELESRDIFLEEEAYKVRSSVYAGMTGLAVTFRSVAEEHIIATELLGDLMEPTVTAPDEYWNLFRYKYDELGNEAGNIASPSRYYKLIINSNDYLQHLITYNKEFPEAIPTNVYRGLVSSTLLYRAWAYLQIGKLYGEAQYYDISFASGEDQQPGRLLSFNELIQELIYNMRVGVDGVNAYHVLDWRTIVNPEKLASQFNQTWNRVSINADAILTELYLWAGDYINAAKTGINFVARPGNQFKLNQSGMNFLFIQPNVGQMINEAITMIPYNFNYRQTHRLQDYFSNVSPSLYYFKPTNVASNLFDRQVSNVEIDEETGEYIFSRSTDSRAAVTFSRRWGSEATIGKYDWTSTEDNQDDSHIYIYRASEIYLMIAEALNGLGNNSAADSLLNVGMRTSWDGTNNYFNVPFESPIYASSLSGNRGLKGRSNMKPNYVRYYLDSTQLVTEEDFKERKKFVLDSLLIEESALELAYEGKRWFTLMRIARNSGHPELLADIVSQKFRDEKEIYRRWLMKPENWFIRWDQTKVGSNIK